MNLILFHPFEAGQPLPTDDPRAVHLRDILRLEVGDELDAGYLDGPIGRLQVAQIGTTGWFFTGWDSFVTPAPELFPLTMVIGTPRPPTARRLLKDLTTLGVQTLHFCATDLGEKSYLQSTLWTRQEYRQNLIEGAQQAFSTLLPAVYTHTSLWKALDSLPAGQPLVAFDPGHPAFQVWTGPSEGPLPTLCLGPERGWSDREREILHQRGAVWAGLGPRILRTETACTVVAGQVLAARLW